MVNHLWGQFSVQVVQGLGSVNGQVAHGLGQASGFGGPSSNGSWLRGSDGPWSKNQVQDEPLQGRKETERVEVGIVSQNAGFQYLQQKSSSFCFDFTKRILF